MGDAAVKILLCGDVKGRLHALYKRFETVNKAAGPFQALFCVGSFCGPDGPGELAEYVSGQACAPVATYLLDALPGAKGEVDAATTAATGECQLAPNLYLLRGSGVRALAGLRVAFLGGHYDALSYKEGGGCAAALGATAAGEFRPSDVSALCRLLEAEPSVAVDLLLTSDWPHHVAAALGAPPSPEAASASAQGAPCVAQLASLACPRYHAAATCGVFYARPPYRNRAGGTTRFVALAHLGAQPAANKWLHALAVQPAARMSPAQLSAATADMTASPYSVAPPAPGGIQPVTVGIQPAGADGAQPWRWAVAGGQAGPLRPKRPRPEDAGPTSLDATVFVRNLAYSADEEAVRGCFAAAGEVVEVRFGVGPDGRPRGYAHVEFRTHHMAQHALTMSGTKLMEREVLVEPAASRPDRPAKSGAPARVFAPGEAAPGCWFCLSTGKDVHLIVSVAEHVYLAVDKGALCDDHVLLVPVEHFASSNVLPGFAQEEMWRYCGALRRCFASTRQGAQLLLFERHLALRGKGGNHAHVNALPLPPAAAAGARQAFEEAAARVGFAFAFLPPPPAAPEAAHQLAQVIPPGAEFFCVTLPDGARLVHPISQGERFSMQFGREVCAALLGTPDKADWRNCTADEQGEEARAAAFKALFETYDPFAVAE